MSNQIKTRLIDSRKIIVLKENDSVFKRVISETLIFITISSVFWISIMLGLNQWIASNPDGKNKPTNNQKKVVKIVRVILPFIISFIVGSTTTNIIRRIPWLSAIPVGLLVFFIVYITVSKVTEDAVDEYNINWDPDEVDNGCERSYSFETFTKSRTYEKFAKIRRDNEVLQQNSGSEYDKEMRLYATIQNAYSTRCEDVCRSTCVKTLESISKI